MAYRDEYGDREGDFEEQLDYAWQIGYREAIDAVLHSVDGETAFQVSELIREGLI